MTSLNKATIIGNIGQVETRQTPNGVLTCSLSVATNHTYTDAQGQKQQDTEWHSIVTWNKLAEQCDAMAARGRLVYVEGRLRTRSWESQDGAKHYKTEIVANVVTFLDKKPDTAPDADTNDGDIFGE